jgi:hypothetical protein
MVRCEDSSGTTYARHLAHFQLVLAPLSLHQFVAGEKLGRLRSHQVLHQHLCTSTSRCRCALVAMVATGRYAAQRQHTEACSVSSLACMAVHMLTMCGPVISHQASSPHPASWKQHGSSKPCIRTGPHGSSKPGIRTGPHGSSQPGIRTGPPTHPSMK